MSAEQDRVRAIAERIAQRVSQNTGEDETHPRGASRAKPDELTSMRESLDELKRKLATIEEHLSRGKTDASFERQDALEQGGGSSSQQERNNTRPPTAVQSPWLSGIYVPAAHPSQEKFGVEEAAVSELVDFFEKEKTCELEPGGKPCTHCDMCSSRGF
ncbi:MAG TPA: hypothetical protein VGC66_19605 [Pyrinomonadaceae bacterium]|jgi:hypothetical protein